MSSAEKRFYSVPQAVLLTTKQLMNVKIGGKINILMSDYQVINIFIFNLLVFKRIQTNRLTKIIIEIRKINTFKQ